MYYTVYIDVMFFENTFINLSLIYFSGLIIGKKTSLKRTILAACICSITNIIGYFLLYLYCDLFQILFYFVNLLIMTFLSYYKKGCNLGLNKAMSLLTSELIFTGILTIFSRRLTNVYIYIFYIAAAIFICTLLINYNKSYIKIKKSICDIEILEKNISYNYTAFIDSGNMLKTIYSPYYASVCDLTVMKDLLPGEYNCFISNYVKTGELNYKLLPGVKATYYIYPVNYTCINSIKKTMPCIICDELIINKKIHVKKAPLCFTSHSFNEVYNILLPNILSFS